MYIEARPALPTTLDTWGRSLSALILDGTTRAASATIFLSTSTCITTEPPPTAKQEADNGRATALPVVGYNWLDGSRPLRGLLHERNDTFGGMLRLVHISVLDDVHVRTHGEL